MVDIDTAIYIVTMHGMWSSFVCSGVCGCVIPNISPGQQENNRTCVWIVKVIFKDFEKDVKTLSIY